MRKFIGRILLLTLALFVGSLLAGAFWLGLVPASLSPFGTIDLAERPGWLADAQLSTLRHDPALCRSVLKEPYIVASPVPDNALKKQCGWRNAVKTSKIGNMQFAVDPLTCEMAAAVALWASYDLQEAAQSIMGSKVVAIEDFGTYDCRRMIGNPLFKDRMSEHATANALDISGFTLADGRRVSVLRHWTSSGPEARFLREAHHSACRYFRVAIGPEFNAAHKDHFHFDRGLGWICR
jgi:hypothetical protein